MARYIDYDEMLKKWHELGLDEISRIHKVNSFNHFIKSLPTADVIEVKHGEWIHTDMAYSWNGNDECNLCGFHHKERYDLSSFNYCPHCGAKMDGGKK